MARTKTRRQLNEQFNRIREELTRRRSQASVDKQPALNARRYPAGPNSVVQLNYSDGHREYRAIQDVYDDDFRRITDKISHLNGVKGAYNRKMRAIQKANGTFGKRGSLDAPFDRSQYISKSRSNG